MTTRHDDSAGRLRHQQRGQGSLRPAFRVAGGGARPRLRQRRLQGPRVDQPEAREGHDIAQRAPRRHQSAPGHRLLHSRPRERAEQERGPRAVRQQSRERPAEAPAGAVHTRPVVQDTPGWCAVMLKLEFCRCWLGG